MTKHKILRSAYLDSFSCLGDKCEDTCCKGWGMQVDAATREKWQSEKPELLNDIAHGEAEWVMKRCSKTDYCIKYDDGLCSVHKEYGEELLGDACNFFPRSMRKVGEQIVMTASISCPEIVRLAIIGGNDTPNERSFSHNDAEISRITSEIKDYAPDELNSDDCLKVHNAFLAATKDNDVSAERVIARIISVAHSMEIIDKKSWAMAADFYLKNADGRLPVPEENITDPFNLLHALTGLVGASKPTDRFRLEQTIDEMKTALSAEITGEGTISLNDNSYPSWLSINERWNNKWEAELRPILKNWIAAQMAINLFPFAGLGNNLPDRATIIGVRFATVKLALMSLYHAYGDITPPDDDIVRVIQSLARFMDHLASPTLSMQIYDETGWSQEKRLRSLIGDF